MSFTIKRKKTRRITVGGVSIGGNAPIAVQSMTSTLTTDVAATVAQIKRLEAAGCEIVRAAVPDENAAAAIAEAVAQVHVASVAGRIDHPLANSVDPHFVIFHFPVRGGPVEGQETRP